MDLLFDARPATPIRPFTPDTLATPADPEWKLAPYPFNKATADVILRSSDMVSFRVRRDILLEASPAFVRILAFSPGPVTTIDVPARSETIQDILLICYPIAKPKKERSVKELELGLRAAMAYELELPITVFEDELVRLAGRDSQSWAEVFMVAYRMKLEDVARRILRPTFHDKEWDAGCIIDDLTAGDYYRIAEYRRRQGNVGPHFLLFVARERISVPISLSSHTDPERAETPSTPPTPAGDYLWDTSGSDLILCSSDGNEFRVHRNVISSASPILGNIIVAAIAQQTHAAAEQPCPHVKSRKKRKKCKSCRKGVTGAAVVEPADPQLTQSSHRVVVYEMSTTLQRLLKLCYQLDVVNPNKTIISPPELVALIDIAERYYVLQYLPLSRAKWAEIAKRDPLPAYFIACRGEHIQCAREAAKHVLNLSPSEIYLDEMEDAPAIFYRRLLKYYDGCRAAAKNALFRACVSPSSQQAKASHIAHIAHAGPDNNNQTDPGVLHNRNDTDTFSTISSVSSVTQSTVVTTGTDAWVREYVGNLAMNIDDGPGRILTPEPTENVYAKASASGQWCTSCQDFVDSLARVAQAIRDIPSVVDEVTFEF